MKKIIIYISLFFAVFCPVCTPQLITTATISGTVLDSSGGAVPDAVISLTNEATKTVVTTKSNADGRYVAPGLSIGTYTVSVQKTGFQTYTVTHVELHPTIVNTVDATLATGQVDTQIQVEASAAQVETATPELSTQVSQKQVETLPLNGRNYQSLSALMPGVTNTAPGQSLNQGGFITNNVMSINGMGVSGTMYYVDGIWNMNTGSMNGTTITPNPDTLQEVRVLQNNYGAQYSLNGGNVVLLQTRSGTSAFSWRRIRIFSERGFERAQFLQPECTGAEAEYLRLYVRRPRLHSRTLQHQQA